MGSLVDELYGKDNPQGDVKVMLLQAQITRLQERVIELRKEAAMNREFAVGYQKLYHQAVGLCVDNPLTPRSYAELPQDQCSITTNAPALIRVFRWPWERKPCRR